MWHSVQQCLQASLSLRDRPVSQSTPTLRHSTNKPPGSDAPTTVQTGNRSTASRVPRQRAPRHTVSQEQCLGRRARVSHSKTPTECTVHDMLSVLCNAVVVREGGIHYLPSVYFYLNFFQSKGTFRALRSAAVGLVEFTTMLARAGLVLSVVHSSAKKMKLPTTTPSATPPPLQLDVHWPQKI